MGRQGRWVPQRKWKARSHWVGHDTLGRWQRRSPVGGGRRGDQVIPIRAIGLFNKIGKTFRTPAIIPWREDKNKSFCFNFSAVNFFLKLTTYLIHLIQFSWVRFLWQAIGVDRKIRIVRDRASPPGTFWDTIHSISKQKPPSSPWKNYLLSLIRDCLAESPLI